jgi:WD40 repeat protein
VLWDVSSGKAIWSRPDVSPFGIAIFSADGRRISLIEPTRDADGHSPKKVILLARATGRNAATYESPDDISDSTLSPDGRFLACAIVPSEIEGHPARPCEIRLVNADSGRPLAGIVVDRAGSLERLTISGDSRQIAATGGDGWIKVWRIEEILVSRQRAEK